MADAVIGYVVSRWGEPTQTFVRREAETLDSQVGAVAAWSLKPPRACGSPLPVVHLGLVPAMKAVIATSYRHPRLVASILWKVMARSSIRNLGPQFVAALTGIAWSADPVPPLHLHAHFGWVAATSAWAFSQCSAIPFTVTLHAFELHTSGKQDRFAGVPLQAAEQVFVVTSADVATVRRLWAVEARVIKMGLPDSWFEPEERAEYDEWLVVSVGSLVPKKGHPQLLHALAQSDPRWRLVICGEGEERERLTTLIDELGLADRVTLAGLVSEEEVRRLLEGSAVFCLAAVEAPSGDRDGTPVAIIEAMARGVPVISTEVGGISDLVGDSGLLVHPFDVESLARALDEVRSPERRCELGASGRRRVVDRGFRTSDAVSPLIEVIGEASEDRR